MAIKINTRQVTATASSIKTLNTKINTDFSEMEQSIKRLNSYWDGTASNNAINRFNAIKNTFYTNRYKAVNNMVSFMNNAADGYEKTETAIQSAAQYFK